MRIVVDSSPLIAFAILNQLELLPQIFSTIHIPQAVYYEFSKWRKPFSQKLRKFSTGKVKRVKNQIAVQLLRQDVDLGEAEAIVLALENGIENILIDDRLAEYAPTQIITEFFKNNGFDGIEYKSSLGEGNNIALFDLESAEVVECLLFEVNKVNFDFKQWRSTT
ncbi:MAG TPA: RES domain-containing protein [bacterium]